MMRLAKSYALGCFRSIALWLGIAIPVILLGILCLGVPLFLLEQTDSDWALYLLVFGAALFLLTSFGAAIAIAVYILRNRKNRLDAAFAPLGISGRGYLTNGRQYHGEYRGRAVHAYFFRGPTFELYLSSAVQTRWGMSEKSLLGNSLAHLANKEPIPLPHPGFEKMNLFADDKDWFLRWSAEANVRELLLRLASPQGEIEIRNLIHAPGAIQLTLSHTREDAITPEAVKAWLVDLLALASSAEGQPQPAATKPLSSLELASRENRGAFTLPAILIALALIGIPTLCFIMAIVVLIATTSAQ